MIQWPLGRPTAAIADPVSKIIVAQAPRHIDGEWENTSNAVFQDENLEAVL